MKLKYTCPKRSCYNKTHHKYEMCKTCNEKFERNKTKAQEIESD